ncbi:hypothetical protein LCGC14_0282580 [marine sediment metagenome]|uniref:Peptidase S24/S26A/S26B/S26C domain-containing protein n=1 Tax=marine sediment metagenome TaxID=412755 RepID=A0A0F9U0J2_9ZZZZ
MMKTTHPTPLRKNSDAKFKIGGKVSCGFPSPAYDHQQPELSLDQLVGLGPRSSLFILEAAGDSMRDHGIYDGDALVVDKAKEAKEGDIVVAVIDSEFLVKQVGRMADGTPALISGNAAYPPIAIGEDQSLLIWAVCTWNLHRLSK